MLLRSPYKAEAFLDASIICAMPRLVNSYFMASSNLTKNSCVEISNGFPAKYDSFCLQRIITSSFSCAIRLLRVLALVIILSYT